MFNGFFLARNQNEMFVNKQNNNLTLETDVLTDCA